MAVFTFISSISTIGFQAAFTTFAATYTGQLLISLATSALLGALSPKPAAAAQRGYDTNVLGPALDHTIIYGKTKVGGVVVYNESTGTNNKFLHRIITVAGHEVESFERIYIDDAYIDFSNLGTSGNVASVVDPDGTTSDRYNNKLRIQVAYGTPTQAANADLVAQSDSKWTASHKLSGIAYLYVRLAFDADVYPNGIPTFTAEIKGKKVFDPRTNTTGWSDNPALCVRDYLTSTGYGLGEISGNIDDDLTKAAADVCDQTVFSKTRYTTNGSFTTGATPYDLISSILPSMGGSLWYAQGKWRMKPAYWTTPVMFLDEDDLRSSISVSTRHSRRDNFNVIKGKFTGPDTNWQSVDYKEVRNESDAGTFVTGLPYSISKVGTTNFTAIGATSNTVGEVFVATGAGTGTGVADLNLGVDNGLTSVADVDLLFTDTMKEARRLGRVTLERNRQQLTIGASFGLKTLGLQVGDNVYITNTRFGWTNKAFEVLSWNFGLTDGLDLQTEMTLRETAESVFDAVDDAATYEADNTNLPSPFFVPVPSLDAAVITTTINEDGTAVPAIDFSWGVSNSEVVDYYDFQWKLSTDATYNSTVVEEPRFRIAPALSNVAYDYRVRAVNTLGIKSNYASSVSPASTGNDLTIPNPPTALVAEGGYSTVKLTWTPPTTNTDASTIRDLFQYQIFRGTTTNPTTFVGRVSGESFTDGGLADDTTYYYRVKAQDFTGNLSAYSANQSVTTEVAPTGARGAGRWNIGVTSLPSTSSGANTDFVSAIGSPVDRDQAWFYTGTAASPTSQGVWLYDSSTPIWIEQDEVIDGNLLVTGTITSDKIDVTDLSAINAELGDVNIGNTLTLTAGGAGFIGGRTSSSQYDVDGFLIARTDKGAGAKGFEVSHTSVVSNKLSGIIHSDGSNMKVFNPTFYTGGSISGGVSNITSSTTTNIGQAYGEVDLTIQGAGGGGGYGLANGSSSTTTGTAGGTTTVQVRANSASGPLIGTFTATGGAAGQDASVHRDTNHDGAGTTYGAGGAGGGHNSAGSIPAASAYGAGGGGGGGDAPSFFDSSGSAGLGGSAGQTVTQSVNTSAYPTSDIYLVTTIGARGTGSTSGAYVGANGAMGVVTYASPLGGTSNYSTDDLVGRILPLRSFTGNLAPNNPTESARTIDSDLITLPENIYLVEVSFSVIVDATTDDTYFYSFTFYHRKGGVNTALVTYSGTAGDNNTVRSGTFETTLELGGSDNIKLIQAYTTDSDATSKSGTFSVKANGPVLGINYWS